MRCAMDKKELLMRIFWNLKTICLRRFKSYIKNSLDTHMQPWECKTLTEVQKARKLTANKSAATWNTPTVHAVVILKCSTKIVRVVLTNCKRYLLWRTIFTTLPLYSLVRQRLLNMQATLTLTEWENGLLSGQNVFWLKNSLKIWDHCRISLCRLYSVFFRSMRNRADE